MHGGYDPALIPDDNFMRRWLRMYLEEVAIIENRRPEDVTDKNVEILFVQVKKFTLVSYFICCVIYKDQSSNSQRNS